MSTARTDDRGRPIVIRAGRKYHVLDHEGRYHACGRRALIPALWVFRTLRVDERELRELVTIGDAPQPL